MKQILILILTLTMIFPAYAFAQEAPKVVEIKVGEIAPYTGVLLDNKAAAEMLTNQKYSKEQCKLTIDYELSKLKAQNDLLLTSIKASLEATENKYESVLVIKDAEIERLNEIALEGSRDYSEWWAAGGFVVGALVTLGIFFAATEVAK